jgi:hypothetical protein
MKLVRIYNPNVNPKIYSPTDRINECECVAYDIPAYVFDWIRQGLIQSQNNKIQAIMSSKDRMIKLHRLRNDYLIFAYTFIGAEK